MGCIDAEWYTITQWTCYEYQLHS